MPEELQGLLERIQKDGVDKADAESNRILAEARKQAEAITADAKAGAEALLSAAKTDAAALEERGKRSLQQAARDIILSVGESVRSAMSSLARDEVDRALEPDLVARLVATAVETYCSGDAAGAQLEILLSAEDKDRVRDVLAARLGEALRAGLDLRAEDSVVSGFRVSIADGKIQHDFTGEAIADAMCQLLSPYLAEVVREAAKGTSEAA